MAVTPRSRAAVVVTGLLLSATLLASLPLLANPLLCSPSMLVGRLTTGATTPGAAVGLCGCTDTVVAAIRSLRMSVPGSCAGVMTQPAPARAPSSAVAPRSPMPPPANTPVQPRQPDSNRAVANAGPLVPRVSAPQPSVVCCELAVFRDGVELARQRVCDDRCTARGVPEVLFGP